MRKNTDNAYQGGTSAPIIDLGAILRERAASEEIREEYFHTDPLTGRILWSVDAYDVASYDAMRQDEETRAGVLAPYFLEESNDGPTISRAARASLGMFVVAGIEDEWRALRG